jgi:hypothetical protein
MAGPRFLDVTLGTVILGGQVEFRVTAGPWWAGFLLAVLGLGVAAVRIVFPQDSPDKLAWWRERWRTGRPQITDRQITDRQITDRQITDGKYRMRREWRE